MSQALAIVGLVIHIMDFDFLSQLFCVSVKMLTHPEVWFQISKQFLISKPTLSIEQVQWFHDLSKVLFTQDMFLYPSAMKITKENWLVKRCTVIYELTESKIIIMLILQL